jgi:hypothetical protein
MAMQYSYQPSPFAGAGVLIRPLVQDLFDPFLDLNGKAGICSAGRDRDLHDAVTNSCGYQEITLGHVIGYIDWYSQAFGGSSHAPVHGIIVGGGEDQKRSPDVRCPESPPNQPDRKGFELRQPAGRNHGHAGVGFQQPLCFPQRHPASTHHRDRLLPHIQKHGIITQTAMLS